MIAQNFQDFSRVITWVFQVQGIARIVDDIKKNLFNLLIISYNLGQFSIHIHVENNAVFF